jgi:hypothetical protein
LNQKLIITGALAPVLLNASSVMALRHGYYRGLAAFNRICNLWRSVKLTSRNSALLDLFCAVPVQENHVTFCL